MTKNELIQRVAERTQLTKKEADLLIETIFKAITEALKRGDKVELRKFGSFRVRWRNAREGRNPKTGDPVTIPPKKFPFFKPGKDLKKMVDGLGNTHER